MSLHNSSPEETLNNPSCPEERLKNLYLEERENIPSSEQRLHDPSPEERINNPNSENFLNDSSLEEGLNNLVPEKSLSNPSLEGNLNLGLNGTPVIYVTGFGPFGACKENASAKVVEKLLLLDIESELEVKLVTEVLDVSYDTVMQRVPMQWRAMNPKLVIHIGVSNVAEDIVLEKIAFNDRYNKPDIHNCILQTTQCRVGFPPIIQTELDLDRAIEDMKQDGGHPVKCSLSYDPGRYLCGFVYYLSLTMDNRRSLFIHVPDLRVLDSDQDAAATKMAFTISALIKKLYQQVLQFDKEVLGQIEGSS